MELSTTRDRRRRRLRNTHRLAPENEGWVARQPLDCFSEIARGRPRCECSRHRNRLRPARFQAPAHAALPTMACAVFAAHGQGQSSPSCPYIVLRADRRGRTSSGMVCNTRRETDRQPTRRRGGAADMTSVAGEWLCAVDLTDDASRGRFLRECIRARTVQNRYVAALYEAFIDDSSGQTVCVLAVKHLGGPTLASRVARRLQAGVPLLALEGSADRLADRRRAVGDPPGRSGARQPAPVEHLLLG